jgi:hypothetical protein
MSRRCASIALAASLTPVLLLGSRVLAQDEAGQEQNAGREQNVEREAPQRARGVESRAPRREVRSPIERTPAERGRASDSEAQSNFAEAAARADARNRHAEALRKLEQARVVLEEARRRQRRDHFWEQRDGVSTSDPHLAEEIRERHARAILHEQLDAPSMTTDGTDSRPHLMPEGYGSPYGPAHPHWPLTSGENPGILGRESFYMEDLYYPYHPRLDIYEELHRSPDRGDVDSSWQPYDDRYERWHYGWGYDPWQPYDDRYERWHYGWGYD